VDAKDEASSGLDTMKTQLEEKTKQCADYLDKLQRTAAEFDNYKKRSAKEKEALYIDATGDVVGAFIPVLDNLERAMQAMAPDSTVQTLKDGVEMVVKQFRDAFKTIGVEEIKTVNEPFDPMKHNAVMHVEDDAVGPNTVVEELQKGYMYKERVIRYSMVKVAN
jgi:molecular chaperone GrpE